MDKYNSSNNDNNTINTNMYFNLLLLLPND